MLLAETAFLNRLSLVHFPTDFQSQQISDEFIEIRMNPTISNTWE